MLETFGLGAITSTHLHPPLGMSGAKQNYECVHALLDAHCQGSAHGPSRGHSCPILIISIIDIDMTVFCPHFSWEHILQLPKENVFVGGEMTVHHFLVLFNILGTCTVPRHFHSTEQVCPCPAGKKDLKKK